MKTVYLGQGDGWRPAGALWRLPATLVDMVVYCALCALFAIPVARRFDSSALWGGIDELARAASDPTWLGHASGIIGLWIALWWCYFAVGWGLLGATPGKWVFGLRIIDYRQRCPIGVARALLRLAAFIVSSVTFEWGHLMMLVRSDRRALHDILAGTRVVRKQRPARRQGASEREDTEHLDGDASTVGGEARSGEVESEEVLESRG